MKTGILRPTSILWLCLGVITFIVVVAVASAGEVTHYRLPLFRQVAGEARLPALAPGLRLRLLADEDFPPYSFRNRSGQAAGLAVDLAVAACAELKIACEVALKPLAELLPALQSGDGGLIVAGPRIDEKSLAQALITRAWFRSFGRFAVQSGKPLTGSSAAELAGLRIATVRNSAHAAWLARYYGPATIVPFATEAEAQEALRTGGVDVLFGDDLRLIYWISGEASHGCCRLLGGAYTDFDTVSRNYSFLVGGSQAEVRDAFDVALDRLQANGTTERIFNTYVPLNPW